MNTPKRYGADGFSKWDGCFVEWEEYAKLSVEVRRLRKASFVTAVPVEHYERIIQAGDAMQTRLNFFQKRWDNDELCEEAEAWNAAKEGKGE